MCAACTLGASASFETGAYVYTFDARYKISSAENLLINGDFSVANPSASNFGWKDAKGAVLSTENWQVNAGGGPDGKNSLKALRAIYQDGDGTSEVSLLQTVPFSPTQTLTVSFKIKAPSAVTTSTVPGSSDYVDVYANEDGSASKTANRFQQVASEVAVGTDWTEVTYCFVDTVSGGSTGSVVIALSHLAAGTEIADFSVQMAEKVYDDRVANRILSYGEYLAGTGYFDKGKEDFLEAVNGVRENLKTDDSEESCNDLMSSYEDSYQDYLNENSSDALSLISRGDISKATLVNLGKYNNKDLKSLGDWTFEGGRWGHPKGADFLSDDIPGAYQKTAGQAYIQKDGLAAGTYMFAVDAMALAYQKKKVNGNYTAPDYAYNLPWVKAFVGKDSVTYTNVDNRTYNTYTAFGKIAEGDTLRVGIAYPDFGTADDTKGGSFRINNAVLRLIGVSAAEAERIAYVSKIYVQQTELLKRLTAAKEDLNGTSPWSKPVLKDSIDKYQPLYDASLAYVNAEGVDQGIDIPEEYDQTLLEAVRAMNRARNNFSSDNKPFTDLVSTAAKADERLKGDTWKDASADSRSKLETEKAQAEDLIAKVTAERDSATYASANVELNQAIYAFEHSCARYGAPAEENVINPYFAVNGGSKSGKAEGWDITLQAAAQGWVYFGQDDRFENGTKAYVGRGNTAFSKNKIAQKITITEKGYYEFRCQAYATNTNKKFYEQMWNGKSGADSVRNSGVYVFFGPDEAADKDSIIVCTKQIEFKEWQIDEVRSYSIFFDKTTDGEQLMELGLDALANGDPMGAGCNLYGFGSVHLYFWGDKQKYLDDKATGIESVPVDVLKQKDGAVYNLMGVKVADSLKGLSKGIYICNGVKFVVK